VESSSLHSRALFLSYAFGFTGLRVTGFMPFQEPRLLAFSAFCSFFDRFAIGMYFSISASFMTTKRVSGEG
jgi:hypothetical protein